MRNLVERLRARYMDTKQMLPCELEHEAAAEIERLTAERDAAYDMSRCQCGTDDACSNLAALRREIVALQANGPAMSRGTCGDGTDWMGTMRDVLNDYASSAATEAGLGDEAREDAKALRAEVVILQSKLKEVPRWWHCDTHGPGSHTAWGCPECVRDMRAEIAALQAQHDDDKSDLMAMQRERDALRDMLDNALLIVRDFATRNPLQTVQGHQIDPWGAHRWLDEYAARRSAT